MTFLFSFVKSRFPYGKLKKNQQNNTKVTDLTPALSGLVFIALGSFLLPIIYGTSCESHGGAGMIQEFVKQRETGKEGPGSSGK